MSLLTWAILTILALTISATSPQQHQCEDARYQTKPSVFILTDISNEPDDQMSLVRLLMYANELDIKGIAATTSTWLRNATDEPTIRTVIEAYGEITENLNANVPSYAQYPSSEDLLAKVTRGYPVYGLAAFNFTPSDAAFALLDAAGTASPDKPLWVTIWGGAAVLAEALHHVSQTENPAFVANLVSSLRVYSISDQDDAGIWLRLHYPELFYIVSLHGFSEYTQATWNGISGEIFRHFDKGGPDTSLVTNDWLQTHIRRGPLGAHYPNFTFIMEGDTPSFFPLIQNGLGDPERPEWGNWGGRYLREDASRGNNVYSNTADFVVGKNGDTFLSSFATIWRWRQDYQYDFAARMAWTVSRDYESNNHHPAAIINGSCSLEALTVPYTFGQSVWLDASGSWDPDEDSLVFDWWHYRDPVQRLEGVISPVSENVTFVDITSDGSVVEVTPLDNITMHIILSLRDDREMPLTSYRRVILQPVA